MSELNDFVESSLVQWLCRAEDDEAENPSLPYIAAEKKKEVDKDGVEVQVDKDATAPQDREIAKQPTCPEELDPRGNDPSRIASDHPGLLRF